MGASVSGFWPGITQQQLDDQPGFFNDCKAWGDWMAERYNHPEVIALHQSLGIEALLSHTTQGMRSSKVDWVSPEQLAAAATRLRELIIAKDARVKPIVDVYAINANDVDPPDEDLAQDLLDVVAIAEFARNRNVATMTLKVNW